MGFVHLGRLIIEVKPNNVLLANFGHGRKVGMVISAFGGKLTFILLCALDLT